MKNVITFPLHDGPITCVKFNPEKQTLATGSQDRTIKYWDVEMNEKKNKRQLVIIFFTKNKFIVFRQISETKLEATPILNICFSKQGKSLFSAAVDSLKVIK